MCKTKPGSSEFSVFIPCAPWQRQNSRSVSSLRSAASRDLICFNSIMVSIKTTTTKRDWVEDEGGKTGPLGRLGAAFAGRKADCSDEMSEGDAERTPERSTGSTCVGGARWLFTPSAIWLYRYNNNYSIEVCSSLNHINTQWFHSSYRACCYRVLPFNLGNALKQACLIIKNWFFIYGNVAGNPMISLCKAGGRGLHPCVHLFLWHIFQNLQHLAAFGCLGWDLCPHAGLLFRCRDLFHTALAQSSSDTSLAALHQIRALFL